MLYVSSNTLRWLSAAAILTTATATFSLCAADLTSELPTFRRLFSLVGDYPIGVATSRTDYESLDLTAGRLYISKMGEGKLLVFDTGGKRLLNQIDGFPKITGVLVVGELHRVYASVPGSGLASSVDVGLGMLGLSSGRGEIIILDTNNLKVIARLPGGVFPDGIAYDSHDARIFVSDEIGAAVRAVDVRSNRMLMRIDIGGEAGNAQYDSVTLRAYVAVQSRDELAVIDPAKLELVDRHKLDGCHHPHGLALASTGFVGYVACDGNDVLATVDLVTMKVLRLVPVAHDPDVLVIDQSAQRLYVASESGNVSTFDISNVWEPVSLGEVFVGADAHSVAVDPITHLLYFPIADLDGHAALRVLRPGN